MKDKIIALVGFMGAGKTAVSMKLGRMLHRKVVSTDAIIERKEKRSISQIFAECGEKYFRKIESEVVLEVAARRNIIVDCGGGVVIHPDNILVLKKAGRLIYLKVSVDMIYERVKNQSHRPLLQVDNPKAKIQELLLKRQSAYEQADWIITTDNKTIDEICNEIKGKLAND